MRVSLTIACAALTSLALAVLPSCDSAQAQDPEKKQDPKKAAEAAHQPSPEQMQEMMAKMTELAAPGEQHKKLESLLGKWNVVSKFRMDANSPWETSKATCEYRSVLGGRFVEESFHGEAMGHPFEGLSLVGYDKIANEYESTWMDTMSTWRSDFVGKENDEGVLVSHGTMKSMMEPKGAKARSEHTWPKDGKFTFSMFNEQNGEMVKTMVLEHTKAK